MLVLAVIRDGEGLHSDGQGGHSTTEKSALVVVNSEKRASRTWATTTKKKAGTG
jgi:hypothetical protein